jgi:hypothetical protein
MFIGKRGSKLQQKLPDQRLIKQSREQASCVLEVVLFKILRPDVLKIGARSITPID